MAPAKLHIVNNRKLVLYIAMSLDGFIAREDGDIEWLKVVERPGEDYGYKAFIETVDTVIMGRKTYEKVLSFGIPFPHASKKCYVLSHSKKGTDEYVEFFSGPVSKLLQQLRTHEGRDIFCDGGAETVAALMKENLIDTFILSIIPVFLGSGISLFGKDRPEVFLQLTNCITYPSGLVQLWYTKK